MAAPWSSRCSSRRARACRWWVLPTGGPLGDVWCPGWLLLACWPWRRAGCCLMLAAAMRADQCDWHLRAGALLHVLRACTASRHARQGRARPPAAHLRPPPAAAAACQVGKTIRVGGWVKTGREAGAGAFAFLEVNDGSCFANIQAGAGRLPQCLLRPCRVLVVGGAASAAGAAAVGAAGGAGRRGRACGACPAASHAATHTEGREWWMSRRPRRALTSSSS